MGRDLEVGAPGPDGPVAGCRPDFLPLERYGLIGDAGTAALVSDEGSIDWLCLPRFDSDPVFGRLLDPAAGHFSIRPRGPFTATRRYLPGTAVLATTFTTPHGRATLHDCFAARPRATKRRGLWPFRYLIRRIEGEAGVVPFEVEFAPTDSFGHRRYRVRASGCRAAAQHRGRGVLVQASTPFCAGGGMARSRLEVRTGERAYVTLAHADRDLGVWPPAGAFAESVHAETLAYWREWTRRMQVGRSSPEAVGRSAITLKLLTFAPSGGVVAAPTTSLPEVLGGERNWDYRHVWVRDASWTVAALFALGYEEEANAYLFWATNAASLTEPRVHTMYDLHGRVPSPEATIDGLSGYCDSRPVRVGNAAVGQIQLDTWGHLVDAAFTYCARGGELDGATWSSVRSLIAFVAESWRRPDHGIWEARGRTGHHVHSKVMCWVALDRGVRLVREIGLPGPADAWERRRDEVKRAVLEHGVDAAEGTFVREFGGREVDAALLQIPIVGFLPPNDARVERTIDRVREELGRGELLYRYRSDDGLPGREGAFLACSFWLAQALALAGRRDEAGAVFEAASARANDVGLLPEEIDPGSGAFLGNFPQGLSHIALLNAATALEMA